MSELAVDVQCEPWYLKLVPFDAYFCSKGSFVCFSRCIDVIGFSTESLYGHMSMFINMSTNFQLLHLLLNNSSSNVVKEML